MFRFLIISTIFTRNSQKHSPFSTPCTSINAISYGGFSHSVLFHALFLKAAHVYFHTICRCKHYKEDRPIVCHPCFCRIVTVHFMPSLDQWLTSFESSVSFQSINIHRRIQSNPSSFLVLRFTVFMASLYFMRGGRESGGGGGARERTLELNVNFFPPEKTILSNAS